MCGICGCGQPDQIVKPDHHQAGHQHLHLHDHAHDHDQQLESRQAQRRVRVEQDILSKNNRYAEQNRAYFRHHQIFALNLVSSPGAGKTTLLVATIKALQDKINIAVIEGDQHTDRDSQRIRAAGAAALQINTGKACHLDAHGISHAVEELRPADHSLLAIENVGNLVCPASFDLGEVYKIVLLSVTEGDDKPLKYPDMFHAADVMIVNKVDLLPYVDFDVQQCVAYARQVNPSMQVLQLSAVTGENFSTWTNWIEAGMQRISPGSSLI